MFDVLFLFTVFVASAVSIKNPSVVIIGGGPAGIAAATKLLENNFENILVLEAEPRIGGRVNSIKFGDAYVELGAEWCHGENDNVVYNLAKDYDILRHTDFSNRLYHSSGKPIDDNFSEELASIRELYYSPDGHRSQPGYITLGEYIINSYNKTVYDKYSHDREKLNIALEALDFYMHYILSSEGAFSWFDPAAQSDYKDCEGDLQLNWNGLGYRTILEILMKKFPDPSKQLPIEDKILLNKEVVSIQWDRMSKREVVVSCSDGSYYTGDHVIFTPSVGVLKERGSHMFIPRLPQRKMEAIENIGLGAVMKLIVLFSSNWWGNKTNFNFIWSGDDKQMLLEQFPEGPSLNGRSWLTNLFTIVKVERNPRILVAWFTGDMVPAIEFMPEETLIEGIYFVLNKFLGNSYRTSEIDNITRSQWYSNPHFRGAYSFQTVKSKRGYGGTQRTSEEDLAEPLKNFGSLPIIQFAGEATHPYYYSTVHGAIETGYREADRIINLYS